jgi:hypothetical protein
MSDGIPPLLVDPPVVITNRSAEALVVEWRTLDPERAVTTRTHAELVPARGTVTFARGNDWIETGPTGPISNIVQVTVFGVVGLSIASAEAHVVIEDRGTAERDILEIDAYADKAPNIRVLLPK